jgi:hypothetical protein
MSEAPVKKDEPGLLQCGCKTEGALLEMVYMKLGFIGEDVAKEKMGNGEKSGRRAMSRPERERTLRLMELLGHDMDELVMLVQG